jgi:hypothetical protein
LYLETGDNQSYNLSDRIADKMKLLSQDKERGGEAGVFLSAKNLAAAVDSMDNARLKNTVDCAYDKQNQSVTATFLCDSKLWTRLHQLGFYRDAAVVKYLGRALQAWSRPGLTSAARTQAMFLVQLVVRRALGRSMFDVRVLNSRSILGFPVHQILDFYYMGDIRAQMMELMPETEEIGFLGNPETMLTTRLNESHFSFVASDQGGAKPSPSRLIGRMHRLDVVCALVADLCRRFNVRISKSKWKVDDNHTANYNSGTDMIWNQDTTKWMANLVARARRAMKNRTGPRRQSKMDGGTA